MNVSEPFIKRPVGTTLLAVALLLVGAVAYYRLPVASLPAIDMPTVGLSVYRPGADPETMAGSVAAPLERRLANISNLIELTSINSLGFSQIVAQFDLTRNVDAAGRDIQAAINAALGDLPGDLATLPVLRKANASAAPILILALTSDTLPTSAIYDATDTVIAQRISQVAGVGGVVVAGAEQPAIRVQVDPARAAAMKLGVEKIANTIVGSNLRAATGNVSGGEQSSSIATNDQINAPSDYSNIVVASRNGAVVKLGDVASVERSVRNRLAAGWYNGKPAVLLLVLKQPGANVLDVVDGVRELLPRLQQWIPKGVDISVLADRTLTIRASVDDIRLTLFISIALVMLVVFVFLRRLSPVVAAGATAPLSLVGSCVAMWAAGFSIDNLSLMALTISVGFVVDDAIVMIENVERRAESGMDRYTAALCGARQIGFTVVSITLSLVAVFAPLLFIPGIAGRLLSEFSYTLSFAVLISMVVSLTVTPMLCAWLPAPKAAPPGRFDRYVEAALDQLVAFYGRTLRLVIDRPSLALVVVVVTIGLTVHLYRTIPKGDVPQEDVGLINGITEASADVSFEEMARLQKLAMHVLATDLDVLDVGSFIGAGNLTPASNMGRFFITLVPADRRRATSEEVIERLRPQFAEIAGLSVTLTTSQDLRSGARQSKATYQYTLSDYSLAELNEWTPRVLECLQKLPELADVSSDRQPGGLRAKLVIDRNAASRLGVSIATIDSVLNSAFGQRQDSLIYTQRNNYRVVVETPRARQRDINDLSGVYVSSASGGQIPLSAVAHVERASLPLVVNHQGVLPAATITFNLAPNIALETATKAIEAAVSDMRPPDGLRRDFAGGAADFRKASDRMAPAILGALIMIYIILGVLYESYSRPITIISTLPAAGLGALLALELFHLSFTLVAFLGILLLIGIVKKNGIMLIDFALQAERERGLCRREAALAAATERLRPILMTTLTALFGALPLALATGIGSELRRPLGVTIVGGLFLSQLLTLYTTPGIYLWIEGLRDRWFGEGRGAA